MSFLLQTSSIYLESLRLSFSELEVFIYLFNSFSSLILVSISKSFSVGLFFILSPDKKGLWYNYNITSWKVKVMEIISKNYKISLYEELLRSEEHMSEL